MEVHGDEHTAPQGYVCAITGEVMVDPVVCDDGYSYERAAIENWFEQDQFKDVEPLSPITGLPLPTRRHVRNHALRKMIEEWRERAAKGGWNIEPSLITIGWTDADVVGKGGYGMVRRGVLNLGQGKKMAVAVKTLPVTAPEAERKTFDGELKVLSLATIRCQGVCRLLGTTMQEGQMHLVMKLYAGSLFRQLIKAPGRRFEVRRTLDIMQQVCRGVAELHAQQVVIGDLKPSNILYDQFGHYVIADFGMSRVVDGTMSRFLPSSVQGTLAYMAPEQFDPDGFGGVGLEADVWALACTVCEMLSGECPWKGLKMAAVVRKVSVNGEHPPIPAGLPLAVAVTLRRCFSRQPRERPTAQEVLETVAQSIADAQAQESSGSGISRPQSAASATGMKDDELSVAELRRLITLVGGNCEGVTDKVKLISLVRRMMTISRRPGSGSPMRASPIVAPGASGAGKSTGTESTAAKSDAETKETSSKQEVQQKALAKAKQMGLFENHVDEKKGGNGRTALHSAAMDGRTEDVKILLMAGGAVIAKDTYGLTPLHCAAMKGNCDALRVLLDWGVDMEAQAGNGSTPLHYAAWGGSSQAVEVLLQAGAKKEMKKKDGCTPLHYAAQNGHRGAMKALLDAQAESEATNTNGDTPLHVALQNKHWDAVVQLLEAKARIDVQNTNGDSPLHVAAQNGDAEAVKGLLAMGASTEAKQKNGSTPLHYAAFVGHCNVVKELLAAGAQTEAKENNGDTPLHYAAFVGHTPVAVELLNAGANREAKNNENSRPRDVTTFEDIQALLK
mmetsp:Transcript_44466/g.111403  ORF Transcript_44466/g.111403 Transcript_44466/m.111403 type:complete len:788 (+) Transcript_44466:160-2523(+)